MLTTTLVLNMSFAVGMSMQDEFNDVPAQGHVGWAGVSNDSHNVTSVQATVDRVLTDEPDTVTFTDGNRSVTIENATGRTVVLPCPSGSWWAAISSGVVIDTSPPKPCRPLYSHNDDDQDRGGGGSSSGHDEFEECDKTLTGIDMQPLSDHSSTFTVCVSIG